MSNIEIDIVSFAKSLPAIVDIVGRRIYGLYREPNAPLPQLLIQRTTTQRQQLFCRQSLLVSADFQLDSYALTGQDATVLAKAVRLAFRNYAGMMGETSVNRGVSDQRISCW